MQILVSFGIGRICGFSCSGGWLYRPAIHTHTDRNTDSHIYCHTNAHPDGDLYAYSDVYPNFHPYENSHGNFHLYANLDIYQYAFPDANTPATADYWYGGLRSVGRCRLVQRG